MSLGQKKPFLSALSQLHTSQEKRHDELAGRAFPCHVVAVDGSIVTVQFDILPGDITLPEVTIPIATSEYIRIPVQVGDKGYTAPASVSMRGISGLGEGLADLSKPPSLSALVFHPVANTKWFNVDPDILTMYGKSGVTVMTPNGSSTVDVREDEVTTTSEKIRLKGVIFLDGPIVQEKTTIGTTARMVGPVTVEFDVTAGNISLINHTHVVRGVQSGISSVTTDKPK